MHAASSSADDGFADTSFDDVREVHRCRAGGSKVRIDFPRLPAMMMVKMPTADSP